MAAVRMCLSAEDVVSTRPNHSAFDPNDPTGSLDLMIEYVLGIPSDTARYTEQRERFQALYEIQTFEPLCGDITELQRSIAEPAPTCGLGLAPIDALRSIWTMVCQSPSPTGVGL